MSSALETVRSLEVAMNSLHARTARADKPIPHTTTGAAQAAMYAQDAHRRFDSVVLPYLADAYALARGLTRNHADSQDVVQDACLRALHGIGNFADGDARTWVLTIVRRTAYDWIGKNRPAAVVRSEDLDSLERSPGSQIDTATAERCLIDWEQNEQLASVVAGLPAHYRQTLALRHVRGLSYREIAESTGISIGTVMSRLSRARRHLTARMTKTHARRRPAERAFQ
jgi:RNA polymerase sigma factor (sigma-70 family)